MSEIGSDLVNLVIVLIEAVEKKRCTVDTALPKVAAIEKKLAANLSALSCERGL